MGGWVTAIGIGADFEDRLRRFREMFSVDGVPELRVETHTHSNRARTIAWAWNRFRVPDVYIKKADDGISIVLCGVITGLGRFGTLPGSQEITAALVLRLWIEHGSDLIKALNGSFSCLFHDQKKNVTTLYTDRFASRPVWFTKEGNVWLAGDLPSAIAALKTSNPKIDPAGLWSLLHTGRHVGTHGLYHQMRCLQAGGQAILSDSTQANVTKWRQRRYAPDNAIKTREWGAQIAGVLKESGRRYRKVCGTPYIFLSGGLDSRIAAAALGKPLNSVSFASMPNAETRIASMVSKVLGIKHQTIIRSPYWYLDTLDAAALISSGNFLTCHTHFIVPAGNIASQNPDVEFLLGDLLENFNKHYFSPRNGLAFTCDPQSLVEIMHSSVPYSIKDTRRLGIFLREGVRKKVEGAYRDALSEYAKSVVDVSDTDADRMDTFLRWADVSITPTFNMITCLRALAGERNIFFDNEVDEINLRIPSTLRDVGVLHKWTLRNLGRVLPFVPDANTFLPPAFPNAIGAFAKKIRPVLGKIRRGPAAASKSKPVLRTSGSWVLMHQMYRKDPSYKGKIEEILHDAGIFSDEVFDLPRIRQTWQEYLAGNTGLHTEIEALLSFGKLNKLLPCVGIEL
ncbi:MAG: hypothetical protein ABIF19_20085 [Planctomycetota bacterium]